MNDAKKNPYLGPRTFEERHAHLFFGREREARELLSTVIAEPLVLFYAPSGAGKSSLINTRLAPGLRQEGFHVLPTGRIGGAPQDETVPADNIFVHNLLAGIHQGQLAAGDLPFTSLAAYISQARRSLDDPSSPLVLIVDQFEELVTRYQAFWHQRTGLFQQLNQALEADPLLWVVLSMREDYVAAVERYARGLPGRLMARFQMQRMRAPAALDAITRPAVDYGRPFAEGVAASLVDNLRQIRAHDAEGQRLGEFVEPVQLQVVCYQLWENLKGRPPGEITAEDVAELGDVDQALGDFYQRTVTDVLAGSDLTELELRTWFEQRLITEDQTRGTVYQGPEETAGLPNDIVRQLADHYLLRSELRAGGAWYELVHDRLVAPILQSNAAWRDAQGPALKVAEAWQQAGKPEQGLYEGSQLKEALAGLDEETAQPLVKEFLAAGQAAQEKRDAERARQLAEAQEKFLAEMRRAEVQRKANARLRLLALGLMFVLVVAIAVGAFAVSESNRADLANATNEALVKEYQVRNDGLATKEALIADVATANADYVAALAVRAAAGSQDAEAAQATADAALIVAANARATADSVNVAANAAATRLASAGTIVPTETPQADIVTPTSVPVPPSEQPKAVILDVPYRSQWAAGATSHLSDDGPAALAMMLNAAGVDISVDDIYARHLPNKASRDFISISELIKSARAEELDVTYTIEANAVEATLSLREAIGDGRPFIALVKYGAWQEITGSSFAPGHFVLVVGYDQRHVYVHDSLLGTDETPFRGAYLQLPNDLFLAGWGGFALENPNWAGIYASQSIARPLDEDSLAFKAAALGTRAERLLDVPFRSQWAEDARTHSADGGPTAVTMLLNAAGVDITPDEFHDDMPAIAVGGFATIANLIQGARSNDLELEYIVSDGPQEALARLRVAVAEGKPFLALVKYEPWRDFTGNELSGGAYVLVVGFDADSVIIHDPYFGVGERPAADGAYLDVPLALFLEGWGGFAFDENPNWAGLYPLEEVVQP